MKVSVVVPWIPAIKGISLAITIAKYLSKNGSSVEFVTHTIDVRYKREVLFMLGEKVIFRCLKESQNERINGFSYIRYQYLSNVDEELAEYLCQRQIDLILVVSDEGHNLAKFLKKRYTLSDKRKAPIVGLLVQELIDYSFMLDIYTSLKPFRKILSPLKHLFHRIEEDRLKFFDFIYSNSEWTSINLLKLYGISARMVVSFVDDELFPFIPNAFEKREGILVPTASLDKPRMEIVKQLTREGINITTYGRKTVAGARNLGFLPRDKMVEVISRARALLFLFNYEALGLIPIESLMIGTPVITEPKQGPLHSLRECDCVTFAANYSELLSICREVQEGGNKKLVNCNSAMCLNRFSASKNLNNLYNDLLTMWEADK